MYPVGLWLRAELVSVCDTVLYSVFRALHDRKWSGPVPSAPHCSTVFLCVSRAQTSLMVFTQVDIWSNQKTHDKNTPHPADAVRVKEDQSVTKCRGNSERGRERETGMN